MRKYNIALSLVISLLFLANCTNDSIQDPIKEIVHNTPPVAIFLVTPTFGIISTLYIFNANSSYDKEDSSHCLQVRWDWESDGKWDTEYSEEKISSHQFLSPGGKAITLEVKDSKGLTESVKEWIAVSNVVSELGTLTDIDGNVYRIVKIGNQWWMAENLKVTRYRNGDTIPNATDDKKWTNLTTGARCVYDNNERNTNTYGYLYNWYAVDDNRKIAPEGWHVSTDEDWTQLELYLGMLEYETDLKAERGEASLIGGQMKEGWRGAWIAPNYGASNASGLSALPGGYRMSTSDFHDIGYLAVFWTSNIFNGNQIWYRSLSNEAVGVSRNYQNGRYGFSVRCVID